jgi:hypothetical protein
MLGHVLAQERKMLCLIILFEQLTVVLVFCSPFCYFYFARVAANKREHPLERSVCFFLSSRLRMQMQMQTKFSIKHISFRLFNSKQEQKLCVRMVEIKRVSNCIHFTLAKILPLPLRFRTLQHATLVQKDVNDSR